MSMVTQKPIEIVVHPDNVPSFVKCARIIQSYIDKGTVVPVVYVEDFFNFMKSKEKYESQVMNEDAEKKAVVAFKKISSNPLYKFEWKEKELPGLNGKHNYDTQGVFFELILAFNLYEKDEPKRTKDEALAFFFQGFETDFKNKLTEEYQGSFTPYKQIVISAILAEAVGFQITKDKDSLKAYFDSSRNAIKKSWQLFPDEEIQST